MYLMLCKYKWPVQGSNEMGGQHPDYHGAPTGAFVTELLDIKEEMWAS